jgi:hypothetical protein
MTSAGITQQLRDASLVTVESDIPQGLTLAEYAAARPRKPDGRLKRVASILLSRKSR